MAEVTKREIIKVSFLGDQSVGKEMIRSVITELEFEEKKEKALSTVGLINLKNYLS